MVRNSKTTVATNHLFVFVFPFSFVWKRKLRTFDSSSNQLRVNWSSLEKMPFGRFDLDHIRALSVMKTQQTTR